MCRFKFAFQTVCVLPSVCVRRAALAAPFRQCAGSNSPFKLLVHFRTSSDGGRLSPHPFNILSLLFYFILAKRQCAGSNSPFKPLAYCRQFVYGGRLSPHPFNILSLLFYLILANGSVPVQIRRQCAAPNSPFKPLVHFRTSSDSGRL